MKCLLLLCLAASGACAQSWQGNYVWSGAESEKVAIAQCIEDGAGQVNFALRPIARSRLTESTKPFQKLVFSCEGNSVTLRRDNDTPIAGIANGTPFDWTRKDGKDFKVSQKVTGQTLVQTFTDKDGSERVNKHIFSDGGLVLEITIKSSSLKKPLTYRLAYKKS